MQVCAFVCSTIGKQCINILSTHRLKTNLLTNELDEFWGEVVEYDSRNENFYIEFEENEKCAPEWISVAEVISSLRENLEEAKKSKKKGKSNK